MGDHVKEVAIAGLVVVEIAALAKGIDGVLFGSVIALIAGIAGYSLRDYFCKTDIKKLVEK